MLGSSMPREGSTPPALGQVGGVEGAGRDTGPSQRPLPEQSEARPSPRKLA